ncbi:ABC transporter permease [Mesorhizobium sp. M00.F.Ca.ET.186.01.1.1]|nr:ABC transporter permease [bacterium M00.F.Ca.ET.205.01.1.1]TGU50501.1 ABC transporter permease [bacterium M00.F.Ca.ET.152.01.1.1]TGV33966.1 ABC transporter permease [Mesorhizobium sp. M00.F.Ca.ET.186.01.1.1]TGZ40865.1 ABC transporter permease [bacterium M00.F.Ca.ET.162.01.1.1]
MLLSPYPTLGERIRITLLWLWCGLVILFLLVPILIPVPLSFNSGAFFIFPLEGLSTRWYEVVLGTQRWQSAIGNSLIVAFGTTMIATTLGTLTAIALSDEKFPGRRIVMPLLLSPLIVPVVITAVGSYLFYARVGLASTYAGIILAHTALASPFVVVTVGASLTGFDRNLMRAAAISGARPLTAFLRVMLPLILPGVLSGAAFAFVTSFDEVVVVQFLASAGQRTMPLEMFIGLREKLSPAITAAATLMMALSIVLLIVANLLARRGQGRSAKGN